MLLWDGRDNSAIGIDRSRRAWHRPDAESRSPATPSRPGGTTPTPRAVSLHPVSRGAGPASRCAERRSPAPRSRRTAGVARRERRPYHHRRPSSCSRPSARTARPAGAPTRAVPSDAPTDPTANYLVERLQRARAGLDSPRPAPPRYRTDRPEGRAELDRRSTVGRPRMIHRRPQDTRPRVRSSTGPPSSASVTQGRGSTDAATRSSAAARIRCLRRDAGVGSSRRDLRDVLTADRPSTRRGSAAARPCVESWSRRRRASAPDGHRVLRRIAQYPASPRPGRRSCGARTSSERQAGCRPAAYALGTR